MHSPDIKPLWAFYQYPGAWWHSIQSCRQQGKPHGRLALYKIMLTRRSPSNGKMAAAPSMRTRRRWRQCVGPSRNILCACTFSFSLSTNRYPINVHVHENVVQLSPHRSFVNLCQSMNYFSFPKLLEWVGFNKYLVLCKRMGWGVKSRRSRRIKGVHIEQGEFV